MERKKKLSLKDIALATGVSTTTVSYVINGRGGEKRISQQVIERILSFIKQENYKPDHLAKSLRTGKTQIICLMVEDISDPFFATLAGFVEELAYQEGYKIIYGSTQNDTQKSRELIGIFKDRKVDGFIITPAKDLENEILQLQAEGIPLVLFDRCYDNLRCNYVGLDNYNSTFNAISYLIYQQRKEIAFITLDSDQTQMSGRLRGYTDAITKYRLPANVLHIPYAIIDEQAESIIYDFLSSRKEIDAIFFATNYLAISGLEAINRLQLQIPDDLSIIAFDDHELFRLYRPAITAVTQPLKEMAANLIEILLNAIRHPNAEHLPKEVIIPAQFTIRDSSTYLGK